MEPEGSDAGPTKLHVDDVIDKDVYDVNGHRMGHVTLGREVKDRLVSFDVELSASARRALDTAREFATVDAAEVVATDFQVTLAEEAQFLLYPERAPPSQVKGR